MNEAKIAFLYERSPSILSQEQQLATTLENTAVAILIFDSKSHLLFAKPAGQKLFEDYEPKLGQKLPADSQYELLQPLLDKARHSQASLIEEIVWPDKRSLSVEVIPIHEDSYVVTLYDISRFKEIEKRKTEFFATAIHDLRNPITSIIGFSYLIKQSGPLNDTQNSFIERIQNATTSVSELLENILSLAEFDLDEEFRKDEVDITHLLFEIANEFQPQAELKRQLLAFERIEENTKVPGDARQLRQALRNLIGNAIKYTPQGGVITISLEYESNTAKIKIKDTGYGIPSSELSHIFERFYRIRNSGRDEIEGNGLGLAIVKSVAEGHGGDVTVESEVGKGSCFTFTLPLLQQELV